MVVTGIPMTPKMAVTIPQKWSVRCIARYLLRIHLHTCGKHKYCRLKQVLLVLVNSMDLNTGQQKNKIQRLP